MTGALLVQQGANTIPEGPAWVVAISTMGLLVLAIVREAFKAIAAKRERNGNGHGHDTGTHGAKVLEARMAGAEAATLLGGIQNNQKVIDAVFEIVGALSQTTQRTTELLEEMTKLVSKSDERWQAIAEATEGNHRALSLHTGLLDVTSRKVDELHSRLPKKRGKK